MLPSSTHFIDTYSMLERLLVEGGSSVHGPGGSGRGVSLSIVSTEWDFTREKKGAEIEGGLGMKEMEGGRGGKGKKKGDKCELLLHCCCTRIPCLKKGRRGGGIDGKVIEGKIWERRGEEGRGL